MMSSSGSVMTPGLTSEPVPLATELDDRCLEPDTDIDTSDDASDVSSREESQVCDPAMASVPEISGHVGPDLSEMVLQPFNNISEEPFDEKVLKEKMQFYPRPGNANMLKVPKLNGWLESKTMTTHKQHDQDLQTVQSYMVATMSAVAVQAQTFVDLKQWAEHSSHPEITKKTNIFVKSYEALMDANHFMTRAMYETNQVRREIIKQGLSNSLLELLVDELKPTPEWLAGKDAGDGNWSMQTKDSDVSERTQGPIIKVEEDLTNQPHSALLNDLSVEQMKSSMEDCHDTKKCGKLPIVQIQKMARTSGRPCLFARNAEIPPPRTDEKPYVCTVCNKAFSQAADVSVHMRTHTGEKPYQCSECGKGFRQSGVRNRHMKTHRNERPTIRQQLSNKDGAVETVIQVKSGVRDKLRDRFSKASMGKTCKISSGDLEPDNLEVSPSDGLKANILVSKLMSPALNNAWVFGSLAPERKVPQDGNWALPVHVPYISECIQTSSKDNYVPIQPKPSSDYKTAEELARNVLKDVKGLPNSDIFSDATQSSDQDEIDAIIETEQQDSETSEECDEALASPAVQTRMEPSKRRHVCTVCGKHCNYLSELKQHMTSHTGEKPHICSDCGKGFSQSSSLHCHMKTHTGEMPHVCNDCGKGYITASNLRAHMMTHTGAKPHVCPVCNKGFTVASNLKIHMTTHTTEKPHPCSMCGKRFSYKAALKKHLKIHSISPSDGRGKPHVCSVCGKGFTTTSYLKIHMKNHTGKKPYSCKDCGKGFVQIHHLNNHATIHTGVKPFTCSVCRKAFRQNGTLVKHMLQHTGEKRHVCPDCGEAFTHSNSLKGHMTKHTGLRPYLCSQCGKGFVTAGNLNSHILCHTGEKPYLCPECGKGFTESKAVKIHMRTHTGEKPYVCSACGIGFSQTGSLTIHMRTHTGEKPFMCPHCGKGFAQSGSLTSHIKTHTDGSWSA